MIIFGGTVVNIPVNPQFILNEPNQNDTDL